MASCTTTVTATLVPTGTTVTLVKRPSVWEGPPRATAWDHERPSNYADAPAEEDLVANYEDDLPPGCADPGHHVGIYGWRKRCLYLLVLLLLAMVVMNVALTVWVIRVLDFSLDGIGRLHVVDGGVRLDGEAEFLRSMFTAQIRSRNNQPLKLESSRNITLNARNKHGRIINRLLVGNSMVEAFAEEFVVRNPQGKLLFRAADGEVSVAADALRVTGPGGVRFDGSVQTPLVRAETFQHLKLESPTRRLVVQGPEGVLIESRSGDMSVSCHRNLTLKANRGEILLDSERIVLQNIKTTLPALSGSPYQNVYQLCVCRNGALFVNHAEGHCKADDRVCR